MTSKPSRLQQLRQIALPAHHAAAQDAQDGVAAFELMMVVQHGEPVHKLSKLCINMHRLARARVAADGEDVVGGRSGRLRVPAGASRPAGLRADRRTRVTSGCQLLHFRLMVASVIFAASGRDKIRHAHHEKKGNAMAQPSCSRSVCVAGADDGGHGVRGHRSTPRWSAGTAQASAVDQSYTSSESAAATRRHDADAG